MSAKFPQTERLGVLMVCLSGRLGSPALAELRRRRAVRHPDLELDWELHDALLFLAAGGP